MKITTANTKSPHYVGRHELFVGTHTGSFKRIDVTAEDPHRQTNLQSIAALNKFSRITSLDWGTDDNEILIGRANKFVKIFDLSAPDTSSNIELSDAPIVGLARHEGRLVAGLGSGRIQIVADTPAVLETGDHMSRMSQCRQNGKLVATGGRERQNNLKVWDLEMQKRVFSSKNVPNDYLQLEVPVWESDLVFVDESKLLTCSRYGYLRQYDTRAQRRPVVEYRNEKEQICYNCVASFDNLLFAGSSTGVIRAFDQRRLKVIAHTYKGFTGSISDVGLDETGKFLYSSALDRYVRIHCAESTALLYQCYVKSKATKILLRTKQTDQPDVSAANESGDCVFMGEELADGDEEEENDGEAGGSDAEFDQIFENLRTIREKLENIESDTDDDTDEDSEEDDDDDVEDEDEKPEIKKANGQKHTIVQQLPAKSVSNDRKRKATNDLD